MRSLSLPQDDPSPRPVMASLAALVEPVVVSRAGSNDVVNGRTTFGPSSRVCRVPRHPGNYEGYPTEAPFLAPFLTASLGDNGSACPDSLSGQNGHVTGVWPVVGLGPWPD